MFKRTKIVCTIGPASESVAIIAKMVKAGMNVARLNFSHGTHASHKQLITHIRAIEKKTGEPIAILQDIQGPKIRIGILPPKGIILKKGSRVVFVTGTEQYDKKHIPIDYAGLHRFIKKGQHVLLDEGHCEVEVIRVEGVAFEAKVIVGGTLSSNKGVNLPGAHLDIDPLTDKDKDDLLFGVRQGVDWVACSFIRNAKDVERVRAYIRAMEKRYGGDIAEPIRVIAKIERSEAVENMEAIVESADGIMVARGDLGLETPVADVPIVQKRLIELARAYAKPVIVATQMLDSMQTSPRPTRAEVSDVANAVIDHTDAVMLSNETATGMYPVEAVATMAQIIHETEASSYDDVDISARQYRPHKINGVLSELPAIIAQEKVTIRLVLAASISGETGRLISRSRPELPIAVATTTERVQRQLNLSWGVVPFVLAPCRTIEELTIRSATYLKKHRLTKKGDKLIVLAGTPLGRAGRVNMLEVRTVV